MNSLLLKNWLPHLVAVALFLIISIVYCKPAYEGKVVSQSDVINYKGMAQQSFEYKEKYGHFPLWTESAFGGMPAYTIAMEQTSMITTVHLYNILTVFGLLRKPAYFFFIACICFYLLTQVLRINPWIGTFASIAYAYCTFDPVLVAVGHDTQMYAIGYAPAIIASVLLIYQKKYLLGAALLTLFFGLQLSTQHVQIVYYTVMLLALLSIAFLVHSWQQKQLKDVLIGLIIALVAGLLGMGTFAIPVLPLQEYAKETKRGGKSDLAMSNSDVNKTKGGLNKDYAFMWSLGKGETFTLMVPSMYGGGNEGKLLTDNSAFADKAAEIGMPEDNGLQYANAYAYWGGMSAPGVGTAGPVYLGAVICFLFIFGLFNYKGWNKWWIVSAALFGVILAWGKYFSAFNYFMFDHFPFYSKFRAPTQALFMPQLAVPLMAALGLNEFVTSKEPRERIWNKFKLSVYVTAALLVLLAGFYFTADYKSEGDVSLKQNFFRQMVQSASHGKQPTPEIEQQATQITNGLIRGLQSDRQSLYGGDLIRTMLLVVLSTVLIWLYLKEKIKALVLIAGLGLLSSYDLIAEGRKYLNDDNFVEPADFENAFAQTPADIQIAKDPGKNFRVFDESGGGFQDAHTSYYHNSIGGYSPAKLGLYQDVIDSQLSKGNMMVYNMLNTRYLIERNPSTGQLEARLNPSAMGPCWLVRHILYVNSGDEAMKALDSVNVRDTAILDKRFERIVPFQPEPDSSASVSLVDNKNDVVDYRFSAKTNQFAVFSEVYYEKGWKAFLDGKEVPYCQTDYILRGLPVPAGQHSIEFRFEPRVYTMGNTVSIWSSLIAYLLLVAAIAMEWRRRKPPVAPVTGGTSK